MKKIKVAIIDSGINANIFPNVVINQVRIIDGKIINENPYDYLGHGTAVTSVILNKMTQIEILSICPGINDNGKIENIISIDDICLALEIALNSGVDIINISMGSTCFSKRRTIDDICKKAYDMGIPIIAAKSTGGEPTLPYACKYVFRVCSKKGYNKTIQLEKQKYWEINVESEMFRILTKEGNKYFAKGNSYAAPYIVLQILKNGFKPGCNLNASISECLGLDCKLVKKMTHEKLELVNGKLDFVGKKDLRGKKIALIPFNKEMHSLIRFEKQIGCNILSVVDSIRKGTVKKDVGELIGLEKRGIKIVGSIEEIDQNIDIIVIGYCDQYENFDSKFNLNFILEYNLNNMKKTVFSFVPPSYKQEQEYKKNNIKIFYPVIINRKNYNLLKKVVPHRARISKPVIGIFGTSSSQGKFTLQFRIKQALEKRGVGTFFLSTEHQAQLFGADFVFADGYSNKYTIKLSPEENIDFLKRIMVYADNLKDCEIIQVGGQSRLIPFYIEEQTFMRNAVFLEGVLPDLAIIVINPYIDPEQYIRDTICTLKALYKCTTVSLAYSDMTLKPDFNGKTKKFKLTKEEKDRIASNISNKFDIDSGCITNDDYINNVVELIINILE